MGKRRGHVGHRVGGGPDGDSAFGLSADRLVHESLRVELVGDGLGIGLNPFVAEAIQCCLVGTHSDV